MKDNNVSDDVIAFLEQSNLIEGVSDGPALANAVLAWKYLIEKETLTLKDILKTHDILMQGKLAKHLRGTLRVLNVRIAGRLGLAPGKLNRAMNDWIEAANLTIQLPMETVFNSPEKMEVEIKKDHVMFEQIHPFLDGNGRIGRIVLNWQRVKVGLPILIIKEEERFDYYHWFGTIPH